MIDPFDVLLDNGAGVEVFGDVVCGGADEFDAALVSLVVRLGADKGGEKAVVDVDDPSAELGYKVAGEDLHVLREDDEVDLTGDSPLRIFGFRLPTRFDGNVVKRQTEGFGDGAQTIVVAYYRGDFGPNIARANLPENLLKAMVFFTNEDREPHSLVVADEAVVHREALGNFGESFPEVGWAFKFDAKEELARLLVRRLLIGVDDVRAVSEEEIGDRRDNAGAVRTGDDEEVQYSAYASST